MTKIVHNNNDNNRTQVISYNLKPIALADTRRSSDGLTFVD